MPQTESFICLEAEAMIQRGSQMEFKDQKAKEISAGRLQGLEFCQKLKGPNIPLLDLAVYSIQVLENILLNYNIYNYLSL